MGKTIISKHGWIVQEIGIIDFGWFLLRDIPETRQLLLASPERPDIDLEMFDQDWANARSSLFEHSYFEADLRESIRVSWVPGGGDYTDSFEPVFIAKINNNGTTFVASKYGIPWCEFE
jgi:hypothetical protein